jgi:hypothetical protein
MPASLAAEFTPGEDAALCIIADECRVHGICDAKDAIAARVDTGPRCKALCGRRANSACRTAVGVGSAT